MEIIVTAVLFIRFCWHRDVLRIGLDGLDAAEKARQVRGTYVHRLTIATELTGSDSLIIQCCVNKSASQKE
jgi:hypothetical protein